MGKANFEGKLLHDYWIVFAKTLQNTIIFRKL
ncbi:hypothetical protein T4C_10476 [Trichinella pseudospiralis]|uniref:Uncharacterized protein n=1 Tax=Trichinella pseudospiralis TaxID=6337 RepID=A0A0V1G905_TRIPS|nr:hypothetical protein T4C_10476 [Trichinella pseudospiralis]